MHARLIAIRTTALCMCALTVLAAACSSSASHGSAATSETTTTAAAATSTTDPNLTPNSIPYVVAQQIGLPNDWTVLIAAVHYPASVPGVPAIPAGERYVVLDITMKNDSSTQYTVDASKLFTLTDTLHQVHYVIAQRGTPNGIDGAYPQGTTRSGKLVFTAPKRQKLGLVLAGPLIGTQVSYFTIDPPTVPPDQT